MTTALVTKSNGWEIRGFFPSKLQHAKLDKLTSSGKDITALDIRVALSIRHAIVVDKAAKKLTFWNLQGLFASYTDSVYDILDEELANPKRADIQSILQNRTGHRAPIIVEPKNLTVTFERF